MVRVNLAELCTKKYSRNGKWVRCRRIRWTGHMRCKVCTISNREAMQRASIILDRKDRCRTCRGPRENPFRTNCTACRKIAVERTAARARRLKEAGLCRCGNERMPGRKGCAACHARDIVRNAQVSTQRRKKREARALFFERKEAGVCTQCGAPAVTKLCPRHTLAHAKRSREYYAKTRGLSRANMAEDALRE